MDGVPPKYIHSKKEVVPCDGIHENHGRFERLCLLERKAVGPWTFGQRFVDLGSVSPLLIISEYWE